MSRVVAAMQRVVALASVMCVLVVVVVMTLVTTMMVARLMSFYCKLRFERVFPLCCEDKGIFSEFF